MTLADDIADLEYHAEYVTSQRARDALARVTAILEPLVWLGRYDIDQLIGHHDHVSVVDRLDAEDDFDEYAESARRHVAMAAMLTALRGQL